MKNNPLKRMQEIAGLITENQEPQGKPIKDYQDVKVGDVAFENPNAGGEWNNEQGKIIWKGTYDELLKSKYKDLLEDWEVNDEDDGPQNYDLVIIDIPSYGPTLFNYNNDPSGVVVFFDEDEPDLEDLNGDVTVSHGEKGLYEELKGKMKKSEFKTKIKEMILAEKNLKPKKKDKEEDIEIPDLADEEPSGEEMSIDTSNSGGGEMSLIQKHLTQAQEEAKALGDEKLINQIGNTLVYLIRSTTNATSL